MGFQLNLNVLNQKGSPAIYTDTFANRPAAGYQGRLFISTDTAAIYEDTGTSWTLIANVSSGAGTLEQVTTNGNTTTKGILISSGGLSTNSLTDTALTSGSVTFAGSGGLISQDNANLFWDDTNNRLGINTNSPGNSLDVHTGGTNPILALNNTAGSQSAISFLNTSSAKWRIGNTATDTFDIYNFTNATTAISIDSGSTVKFITSPKIKNGTGLSPEAGYGAIGFLTSGVIFQRDSSANKLFFDFSGFTAQRTFICPNADGTIALTSNLSSYLPLTGGTLTGALTVNVGGGLPALNIGNSSLSAKTWTLIPTTNSVDSDLAFYYTGTSSGTKVTFANNGNVGIGTSTPSFASGTGLQINNASRSNLSLSDGTNTFSIFQQGVDNYINNTSTGDIIFRTTSGNVTRFTIASSGNVGINTTDLASVKLRIKGNGTSSSAFTLFAEDSTANVLFYVRDDGYTNTGTRALSPYNNPLPGSRTVNVDASGNLGYLVSTRESKENIESINDISYIFNLNPVQFNYRKKDSLTNQYTDELNENINYGFIADEVEQVNKELVFYNILEDGTKKLAGVEYNNMIALLTKAVQQQQNLIENLLQRIELLENK